MLRVLREWVLARSAPASLLARACPLHLLCRDAGFLHDAGMMVVGAGRVGLNGDDAVGCAHAWSNMCGLTCLLAQLRSRAPVRCISCAGFLHDAEMLPV